MRRPTGPSNGAVWEGLLERWHHRYQRTGAAVVTKTDPPIVRRGRALQGGWFQARYSGLGPVDYIGCACGRAVAFDAKAHAGPNSWPLAKLKPHQAGFLTGMERAGALCWVALRFGPTCWVVPWPWLAPLWLQAQSTRPPRGTKSISLGTLQTHAWRMTPDGWLPWVQQQVALTPSVRDSSRYTEVM